MAKRKDDKQLGLGQLSMVEHALCPLDPDKSIQDGLVHRITFSFTDKNRHRKSGTGTVRAAFGLSATDEFFLWGLLGLTFAQPEPCLDFRATPHYILRELGRVGEKTRKGGSAYVQLRESLKRLAGVTYESDSFYDPIRGEHRRVAFGFLSYSLPSDDTSNRDWRIVWDPLFFEFCKATGGRLFFDLDLYRTLDPTSRRLFLFLSKFFWRNEATGWMDVADICQNVLGVAGTVAVRDLKSKRLKRSITTLESLEIIARSESDDVSFRKREKGAYDVRFVRGPYFDRPKSFRQVAPAICETLRTLGVDEKALKSVLARYKPALLSEWADITLAAIERFGMDYFQKSPAAFFLDNVKHASTGNRTPPDWWHELRRIERRVETVQKRGDSSFDEAGFREYLKGEARTTCDELVREMFQSFLGSGQSRAEAQKNAAHVVRDHLKKRFLANKTSKAR